jgi:hypothetical protein
MVVSGALLVGCGGQDTGAAGGQPLSRQQYLAKADAVCSELNTKVEQLIAEKAGDIAGTFQAMVPLVEDALGELRQLRPPAEIQPLVTEWMALNERAPDEFRAQGDAYEGPDDETFEAEAAKLEAHENQADALAAKIGMKVCSDEGLRG